MKVLWIVNHQMADLAKEMGGKPPISGSWLVEISKCLSEIKDIELNVLCPSRFQNEMKSINGINYYLLKMNVIDRFYEPTVGLHQSTEEIIKKINPDIIHIHGSEFAFGEVFLEQKMVPVVISIQGLISEIVKGGHNSRFLKEKKSRRMSIYVPQYLKNIRDGFRAKAEIKQLQKCEHVIGRTDWDKAHSYYLNTDRKYYYLQETMRACFFQKKWDINAINRYTIFCAGGYASPLKGMDKVLESIYLLKEEFPNIQIRIPGEDPRLSKKRLGYKNIVVNYIDKMDIWENILFLGTLNEEQMADEFSKAHIYVMGSSIENSSNTMGEAMCIGTPSIVTYVGGLPSLGEGEKEVLFYNFGDVEQLAWQIRKIFIDDELSKKLSINARKRSINQYDSLNIIDDLRDIYTDVINNCSL